MKCNKLIAEYNEVFRSANPHLHDVPELTFENGKYRIIWGSHDSCYSEAKLKVLIATLKARARINAA